MPSPSARSKGRIAGLNVTILGDILYSRVARSDIWALTKLGAKVTLCGPSTLVPRVFEQMGARVTHDVDEAIRDADIINLLRIQHERQRKTMFPSLGEYTSLFGLNKARLARTKPDALIMHPGPINRGVEIDSDIADCEPLGDPAAGDQRPGRAHGRAVPGQRRQRPPGSVTLTSDREPEEDRKLLCPGKVRAAWRFVRCQSRSGLGFLRE